MNANPYYILAGCILTLCILGFIRKVRSLSTTILPRQRPVALDRTHREEIRNIAIETKSSALQAWFSRISGLPETQHVFGQTIDFAQSHFAEDTSKGLYGNGYRHFKVDLALSPSLHTKFRLTLAPWDKISAIHFMHPADTENRVSARKAFAIYKTYLEAELGTANKTEGEDTERSERCCLIWKAGGLQLSLKLYRDGREQMLSTGLCLSHKELTDINKENRAKFYRPSSTNKCKKLEACNCR